MNMAPPHSLFHKVFTKRVGSAVRILKSWQNFLIPNSVTLPAIKMTDWYLWRNQERGFKWCKIIFRISHSILLRNLRIRNLYLVKCTACEDVEAALLNGLFQNNTPSFLR